MSIEMYHLYSYSPENIVDPRMENGERFYQGIKIMELKDFSKKQSRMSQKL